MLTHSHLLSLIDKLAPRRIIVVGDVILDEYLIGRTDRLSREAPIPVLEFERRDLIPGGAGNPAANIAALDGTAIQVGVVGEDANGAALREALKSRGIDTAGLVTDPARPTTTKQRLMATMGLRFPQQIARMDWISRRPINGGVEKAIIEHLKKLSAKADAIMVSDYMTGLMTIPVVEAIRDIGHERNVLITSDAQGEMEKYTGFDLVKCNAEEAQHCLGRALHSDEDFAAAGAELIARLGLRGTMLITRGPEGITLAEREGTVTHLPAVHIEDVYDTVGAGDTVLAVVTLALASGIETLEATALANLAAGIVIRKVGNYAPSRDELRAALRE